MVRPNHKVDPVIFGILFLGVVVLVIFFLKEHALRNPALEYLPFLKF